MTSVMPQVLLPVEEFAIDLESLGRANGNMFRRRQAVPGVHDGQVMIRLKKKRFIILDYTIQPNDADLAYAKTNPHVEIPNGAGRKKCNTSGCNKIGVPVKLYDSEPDEPVSLYLRSGLCFECQRNLNETRRMDRKRPKKDPEAISTEEASEAITAGNGPNLIYALAPSNKKFRLNGSTIQLNSDAIIINGAVEGTKPFGEGYGFQEIGHDLHHCAQDAAQATETLLNAVACHPGGGTAGHAATSGIAAAPSMGCNHGDDTTTAAVGGEDISAMYDRAFLAMNRSIFLLSQWKASWDVAIAAANETVSDPSFVDVVASAEAVAASGMDQGPTSVAAGAVTAAPSGNGSADLNASDGHHMVSLLLAADKDKQDVKGDPHVVIGEHDAETAAAIHDVAVAVVDAGAAHDDVVEGDHGLHVDDILVREMVAVAEGEEHNNHTHDEHDVVTTSSS